MSTGTCIIQNQYNKNKLSHPVYLSSRENKLNNVLLSSNSLRIARKQIGIYFYSYYWNIDLVSSESSVIRKFYMIIIDLTLIIEESRQRNVFNKSLLIILFLPKSLLISLFLPKSLLIISYKIREIYDDVYNSNKKIWYLRRSIEKI